MTLTQQIERMLDEAKEAYQRAAASHAMSKVSEYGGRVAALEDVLKLIR